MRLGASGRHLGGALEPFWVSQEDLGRVLASLLGALGASGELLNDFSRHDGFLWE